MFFIFIFKLRVQSGKLSIKLLPDLFLQSLIAISQWQMSHVTTYSFFPLRSCLIQWSNSSWSLVKEFHSIMRYIYDCNTEAYKKQHYSFLCDAFTQQTTTPTWEVIRNKYLFVNPVKENPCGCSCQLDTFPYFPSHIDAFPLSHFQSPCAIHTVCSPEGLP